MEGTTEQALQTAIEHHRGGRLAEAEAIYRQILSSEPRHADSLHLLGVIATHAGKYDAADELLRRAIAANPSAADFHTDWGNLLRDQGKTPQAIAAYQQAMRLEPRNPEIYINLGVTLMRCGKFDEAIAAYRKTIEYSPNYAEAYNNLGITLLQQLKTEEAIAACAAAIQLNPGLAEAYCNMGLALAAQGKQDEAAAKCSKAVELDPGNPRFQNNLGTILKGQGKSDDAAIHFSAALRVQPTYADALSNLGGTRMDQGRLDEALACYDRALALKPNDAALDSNRVYAMHFHPGYDSARLLNELRQWDRRHGQSRQQFPAPKTDPSPQRRLRIGYVSPDFRDHVVGRNLVPLFRETDHQALEIFGYSGAPKPDSFTEYFRSCSDHWRNIASLSHQQVFEQIRADRIDILVDMTLHMAGNRLPVFGARAAPVQVTWLGYPGTTGMSAMDYRLTDPYLDPPGEYDGDYIEQSIRLPHSFVCYDEAAMTMGIGDVPQVAPLPALDKGHITFGSLNNFCKINDPLLKIWSQVLQAVGGSVLLLLGHEGSHRQMTVDWFAKHGIDPSRLRFVPPRPRREYLEYYNQIDIGLDTFPYGGYTTSLDSYWMGVPVVTLVGKTVVGRAGVTHVMNLGLPELLAHTSQQYVEIAKGLASNLSRLSELRAGLRERLRCSPLSDARRFAKDIEGAHREMWRRWCGKS